MENELTPISREYWMPDATTKSCIACEKPFTAMRRKHHCRICGFIFCSDCCEYVKNGKETSRICVKCYTLRKRGDAPLTPLPNFLSGGLDEERNFSEFDIRLSKEATPQCENSASSFSFLSDDPDPALFEHHTQTYCDSLLSEECEKIGTQRELDPTWRSKIGQFVREAVASIFIETFQRGDEMDVNTYLRVVKLQHKDSSLSEFFNGVAFLKNIAHKKMKVKIPKPSILILSGGAEFSSGDQKLLSMEAILDQEPDFTKIFMRKLAKLKPSLVIVEKSMSQWIISELARFGVAAIINVKMKIIEMIARVTHGKPLSDIDLATQTKNCIGHCTEMVIKPYQRSGVVYLRTGAEMALGGSIVLTGPSMEELSVVKKTIRELCVKYRNWRLECSFFAQMRVQANAELTEEVSSMQLSVHHLKAAEKMCMKPHVVTVQMYSKDDKPLVKWICDTLQTLDKPCESCEKSQSQHSDYYLKKEGMVQVKYSRLGEVTASDNIELKWECKECQREGADVLLNMWSREYSFYRFLACFFIDARAERLCCGHLLFKDAVLTFSLPYAVVTFEYFVKTKYTLLPIKPNIPLNNYYHSLAAKILSESQFIAKDLCQKLLHEAAQIKGEIAQFFAQNEDIAQSAEGLKAELNLTYDELILALTSCDEILLSEDLLEAEFIRRNLFLDVCKFKVTIQTYKQSLKTMKMNKQPPSPSRGVDWLNFKPALPDPDVESDLDDFQKSSVRRSRAESAACTFGRSRSESTVFVPHTWLALEKSDPILTAPGFELLQRGSHTLMLGVNNTFTPVYETDPLSVIAYVLNSAKHRDEVNRHFQYSSDLHEVIESELLSGSEFALESSFSTSNFNEVDSQSDLIRIYGPAITFQITAYYARQFQAIRLFLYGAEKTFIQAILTSNAEQQNLGKSGARFFKSHDEQFIAKIVEEKEFQMFVDMAPNYFRHICKSFYHNMPSRLVRTLGVYKLGIKNMTTNNKTIGWVLLMENLGFGVNPKAVAYDLKGTLNSRRYVKEGERQTKMDLNFIEDMGAIPISIDFDTMSRLHSSIWNDTLFLYKQNVIDYSLVLLISEDDCQFAAGIIDYLRQYTFDKAIESKYKKVIANELPTITNPVEYKERFRTQVMQDYFLTLDAR